MGKRGPKPKKKVFNLFTEVDEDIKRILLTILFFCLAIITVLSVFQLAGVFGKVIAGMFLLLFGKGGYALVPISFLVLAWYYFHMRNEDVFYSKSTLIGISLILLAFLSILNTFFVNMFEVVVKGYTISIPVGGYLGYILYFFTALLGKTAGVLCLLGVMISGFLIAFQNILNLNHLPSLFGNIRTRRLDTMDEVEEEEDVEEEPKEMPTPSRKFKGKLEILNSGKREEEVMDLLSGKFENYKLPSLNLLESDKGKPAIGDVRSNAQIIKDTFHNFGIEVEMREVCVGPTVTQYTLKPAQGVKLSKIEGLNKDLALALAAHPIRIEAPIPGKSLVGIEVPNEKVTMVRLRNLLSHSIYQQSEKSLLVALGRDVANEPIFINLAKQPHLLIAGATGSGKSIAVQSIITSLLYRNSPESLRLIMVDPKKVELSFYEGIPHLLTPVITDCKKVLPALRWANTEMERRYNLLVENHCKDIESYNKKMKKEDKPILPNIVIIIDELAELMMRYGKDVEAAIVSLAQMARAVGVHLLISTQRPSVEVITGLIKANIPARVACQVMSQIDSRTILDGSGAEKLVGNGDMLYLDPASSKPKRIQGAFVSEEETKKITDFIREQDVESNQSLDLNMEVEGEENGEINLDAFDSDDSDPLLQDAIDEVVKSKKASASYLQRRLKIGYSRAARILDILEEKGIIGPANGSKPREVYIDNDNE